MIAQYACKDWSHVTNTMICKKPDIVAFILDDVTIFDVSTGGIEITTGQITGLEVVLVVTVTTAAVAGVAILCDKLNWS